MRSTNELLYDSEASLRLVDRAIGDLSSARAEHRQSYADTAAIVVRFCQGAGLLDTGRVEALQHMPWQIGKRSSDAGDATTTEILDGLRRAVALVDALDDTDGVSDDMRCGMAASFRLELALAAEHVKTHTVTPRQVADILALSAELRARVEELATTTRATVNTCHAISA